jgi:hypothetical protein
VTDAFWPTTKFLPMVLQVMIRRTEPRRATGRRHLRRPRRSALCD